MATVKKEDKRRKVALKAEEREEAFKKFEEVLKKVESTRAERTGVADLYRKYLQTLPEDKADEMLVFLGGESVRRKDIPKLLEDDPEFYKRYKKLITPK